MSSWSSRCCRSSWSLSSNVGFGYFSFLSIFLRFCTLRFLATKFDDETPSPEDLAAIALHRLDALAIIARACELTSSVDLVTNGAHVTPEVAGSLGEAGVRSVQLTLLAGLDQASAGEVHLFGGQSLHWGQWVWGQCGTSR